MLIITNYLWTLDMYILTNKVTENLNNIHNEPSAS